jgi:hypothetical protein
MVTSMVRGRKRDTTPEALKKTTPSTHSGVEKINTNSTPDVTGDIGL